MLGGRCPRTRHDAGRDTAFSRQDADRATVLRCSSTIRTRTNAPDFSCEPVRSPGCHVHAGRRAVAPPAHFHPAGPVAGRIRHRYQRVRQHGPDAGHQPRTVDHRSAGRAPDQRLRHRRGGGCASAGFRRRRYQPAQPAAGPDGLLRDRQPGQRAGPQLPHHAAGALRCRPAARRLFRRGDAGGGLDQPAGTARRSRVESAAGTVDRDPGRQSSYHLAWPAVHLAHCLRPGQPAGAGHRGDGVAPPCTGPERSTYQPDA